MDYLEKYAYRAGGLPDGGMRGAGGTNTLPRVGYDSPLLRMGSPDEVAKP